MVILKDKNLTIGITGSIATGKSTVVKYIVSKGYSVIDLDQIAREVLVDNEVLLNKLADEFGAKIINSDGSLDRNELGSIIFGDSKARQKLDRIMHPAIFDEMKLRIQNLKSGGERVIFCDVPLLYEADMSDLFDEVWVVYSSPETQLKRLMDRDNIDKEYALKKINSQISILKKRQLADEVITNDLDLQNSYNQVDKLLKNLNKK